MSTPFKDLKNVSNGSVSSYETAWSTSFDKRGDRLKAIKTEATSYQTENEEMENNISTLENDISMLSVSSPKNYHTPSTSRKNIKRISTPGSRIINDIPNEEGRNLFRSVYPELFMSENEEQEDDPPRIPDCNKIKLEPLSDNDEDNEKENISPLREVKREKSSSPDSDEAYQNYLRKLREEPKKVEKPERTLPKRFIVEDDEEESSDGARSSCSSDSEEYSSDSEIDSEADAENNRPSKQIQIVAPKDDDEYFLQSLSIKYDRKRHPETETFVKDGAMRMKKNREALMNRLADIYKRRCFSEIPDDMLKMEWNARLRKSAGQCRNHRTGNSTIEMSPIVCTTAERVRDTLIHEMCHAAVWIVDKLCKEGHGPGWKKWAFKCMREFRCLPVIERCHSYEIEAKFFYVCENEQCKQTIKRQSKSLDMEKKICGKCKGRFILYRFDRRTNTRVLVAMGSSVTTTVTEEKSSNAFSVYVKSNYGRYKSSESSLKHAEIMKQLSIDYKLSKSETTVFSNNV